jgi:hypothetical protein
MSEALISKSAPVRRKSKVFGVYPETEHAKLSKDPVPEKAAELEKTDAKQVKTRE